jgi:hypothetical protein
MPGIQIEKIDIVAFGDKQILAVVAAIVDVIEVTRFEWGDSGHIRSPASTL